MNLGPAATASKVESESEFGDALQSPLLDKLGHKVALTGMTETWVIETWDFIFVSAILLSAAGLRGLRAGPREIKCNVRNPKSEVRDPLRPAAD